MSNGFKKNNDHASAPALFDRFRQTTAAEHNSLDDGAAGVEDIADVESESQQPQSELDHVTSAAEKASEVRQGRLSTDARRALVSLLRHGVLLAHHKQQLFDIVVKEQISIQDHLADMFLRVLIDEPAGVAVLLQQEVDEEQDSVSLITRRPLALYDTLVLLVLRKHYQERESAGEQRIYIDIDRIESRLTPFLPLTNNSRSDRRKLSSCLKKMKERRLLQNVPGDDERFEITPVIRYVVNAEFLEKMLGEYQALALQAGVEIEANTREP